MLTPHQWAFAAFHLDQDHREELEARKAELTEQMALQYLLRANTAAFMKVLKGESLEEEGGTREEREMMNLSADPYFGLVGAPGMPPLPGMGGLPPMPPPPVPFADFGAPEPPPGMTLPPFPVRA